MIRGLTVSGRHVYAAVSTVGFQTFDVSDPAAPSAMGAVNPSLRVATTLRSIEPSWTSGACGWTIWSHNWRRT